MLLRSLRFAALMFALPSPGLAVDGVHEINQTCATAAGCIPGDGARFPVTITAPGSYRLTSDLVVPDQDTSAIRVEASDVSLDLNGFTISGVTACPGLPPVCVNPGTGNGVEVDDDGLRGSVAVRNGSIRGMGRGAVRLGWVAVVEDVRVRDNGFVGIELGSHGIVRDCQALSNGSYGITASSGLISGNVASANGLVGIQAGGTVSGNTATLNGMVGIRALSEATIVGNTAAGNWGTGIQADVSGATVANNNASDNAGPLGSGPDHGIACSSTCSVRGNTARGNSGFGLSLGADSAYGENVLTGNALGAVSGGVNTGANHCAGPNVGAPTCP